MVVVASLIYCMAAKETETVPPLSEVWFLIVLEDWSTELTSAFPERGSDKIALSLQI